MKELNPLDPYKSPSSRRAWIEIAKKQQKSVPPLVALLAEGVDRNWLGAACGGGSRVALLAEGVDRNSQICEWAMAQDVALLAEGVDRNTDLGEDVDNAQKSPSSRRAWIEIQGQPKKRYDPPVALLAEGVDRNWKQYFLVKLCITSPSSRRAWIEIAVLSVACFPRGVALLAEGVDRNLTYRVRPSCITGRPPRGGRG